nr:MAG TPA: hypothetical protein [Bacteriophage sp.]
MIFFNRMIFIYSRSPADIQQQQIVKYVKGCCRFINSTYGMIKAVREPTLTRCE